MYSYFAIAAFVIRTYQRRGVRSSSVTKIANVRCDTESSSGMFVLAVIPESPADRLGLLPGEQIEKVNGVRITRNEHFMKQYSLTVNIVK